MTSIEMYEKKVLELFHMYANGDIDIREFLTTIHNFYYEVEEMHKQEMKEMYLKGIENYDPTFKRKNDTLKDYHIVDTNEMVDQVPDVRKMKRSAVTFLIEQIEGRGYFSNEFPLKRKTIEHIIKRALEIEQEIQETLYTEEQVREVVKMAQTRKYNSHFYNADEIIQSLKQPK